MSKLKYVTEQLILHVGDVKYCRVEDRIPKSGDVFKAGFSGNGIDKGSYYLVGQEDDGRLYHLDNNGFRRYRIADIPYKGDSGDIIFGKEDIRKT